MAFPCPDCRERSFATEAGLYSHRFDLQLMSIGFSAVLLTTKLHFFLIKDSFLRPPCPGEADQLGLQVHQSLHKGLHHAIRTRNSPVNSRKRLNMKNLFCGNINLGDIARAGDQQTLRSPKMGQEEMMRITVLELGRNICR